MDDVRDLLVLYTGGTIGMVRSDRGYVPERGWLADHMARLPAFRDPWQPRGVTPADRQGRRIRYRIHEYAPLVDSSNLGMDDWNRIAGDIAAHHDDYDAFLVLHGTDTMAYTAAALSFILEGLGKTVILTGSQIPMSEVRNDGQENLLGAMTLAGRGTIPEVGLYFRNRLYRGNRARKLDTGGFEAFDSPNAPPLAEVGIDVHVHRDRIRPVSRGGLQLRPITNRNVAAIRLFPGLSAAHLRAVLAPPIEGVVLETFGSGNAPDNRPDLFELLADARERGVVVVNVTQCVRGRVVAAYAGGVALEDVGVVPGADLTPEAALTKLAWLLSRDLTPDEVRERMGRNLRGELTEADAG